MTDAERFALEWLETWAAYTHGDGPNVRHARTLKAMLAEPRLPEEPTPEMLDAMHDAWCRKTPDTARAQFTWMPMYRALYAHLTKPKTKEMWLVSWVDKWDRLHEHYFDTLEIATPNYRGAVNNVHYHDAKLSGPHLRQVFP